MIKKSVFEDDLIRGMQSELVKQAHNVEVQDLSVAADYLNSASELLEEAGMISASNEIVNILIKIADSKRKRHPVQNVSRNVELMRDMQAGDPTATAKVNKYFRDLGKSPMEIINMIGMKHFMTEKEIQEILFPKEVSIIPNIYENMEPEIIEEVSPEMMLSAHRKLSQLKNDSHTKGLTSEKMLNNLKQHGTVFNMADDGQIDYLLNNDLDNNNLEVSENDLLSEVNDFEDERD